jgi:ribosomal subunit interface protein
MKLPLQVTFRDMAPLPSLEPEIRRRAAKLDQWAADVMSCHVVVSAEANRHHQGHVYTVQIDLRVPGQEIIAGTHHTDTEIYRAVAGAFDAADRQLEDHVRRQRGQVKHHTERAKPAADDDAGE